MKRLATTVKMLIFLQLIAAQVVMGCQVCVKIFAQLPAKASPI